MRSLIADWIWLLLFGALVTGFMLGGWSSSNQIPPQQQGQRSSAAHGKPEAQPAAISESHSEQGQTQANEKKEPHGSGVLGWISNFFEVKLTDLLIAIFTVVLALKTSGLFKETAGLREATFKLYEAGEKQIAFLKESSTAQSRDMQHSIRVAIAAVKVAHKSNVIAQNNFIFSQRPRLTWKLHGHGYIEPRGDGKIYLQVDGELTNVGKTPTSGVYYFGKIYVPQKGEAVATPGMAYYDEHLATKGKDPALIASIMPDETAQIRFMPQGIDYKLPETGDTNLWLAFHAFYHFGFDPSTVGEIASIYRIVRTGTVHKTKNPDGTETSRISVHIQEFFSGARRIT